jgi:uncharacterized protein YbgA (DUF1722 family)
MVPGYLICNATDIQAYQERCQQGKVSIRGPKNIIALWIARDGDELLGNQTFFMPFPENLNEPDPAETDRGRDLWGEQG